MKVFIILLSLFFAKSTFAQWITDSLIVKQQLEFLNLSEPNELYPSTSGTICSCDLLYKNDDTSDHVVQYFFKEDNKNLLFFRVRFKDEREIYGSFKKVEKECGGDPIYCWVQDLIWYYFGTDLKLKKVEFFEQGSKVNIMSY